MQSELHFQIVLHHHYIILPRGTHMRAHTYREVYLLEWAAPFDHVSCTKCPPDSEFLFLPDWFIEKLPPPNPKSTEESVPHKS